MKKTQTMEVCNEFADFTRKLLHKKGYQFVEKNIGTTWYSRPSEVIEFSFICDPFQKLEITQEQTQYEQNERNKPKMAN